MGVFVTTLCIVVIILGFTAFTGAPYVPSRRRDLKAAFSKLYPLSSADTLVDVGAGDGVVLRVAREYGAHAVGYELGPVYVFFAKLLSRHDKKQDIIMADYWRADFPPATTVVYAFSDSRDIAKLYRKLQQQATRLKKTLYFISYGFDVPGVKVYKTHGAYFLYTVPPCPTE